MRRRILGVAALAALAVPAASALAAFQDDEGAAARTIAVDPAEIVKGRQTGFHLSAAAFIGIRSAIERGDDVKRLAFPIAGMVRWAKLLPSLFPAGTALPESEAAPTIWSDREGFEATATLYAERTESLLLAAKAGDADAAKAAVAAIRNSCDSCHEKYRIEKQD